MISPLALTLFSLALLAHANPVDPQDVAVSRPLRRDFVSWSSWVDDLITSPDEAMTVDQVMDAFLASDVDDNVVESRDLEKRARCNYLRGCEAPARDVVACINDLANKGRNGVICTVNINVDFCNIGQATIAGGTGSHQPISSSNCNDIARAAGIVMDNCYRADDTVQGQHPAWGNGDISVNIFKRNC